MLCDFFNPRKLKVLSNHHFLCVRQCSCGKKLGFAVLCPIESRISAKKGERCLRTAHVNGGREFESIQSPHGENVEFFR